MAGQEGHIYAYSFFSRTPSYVVRRRSELCAVHGDFFVFVCFFAMAALVHGGRQRSLLGPSLGRICESAMWAGRRESGGRAVPVGILKPY